MYMDLNCSQGDGQMRQPQSFFRRASVGFGGFGPLAPGVKGLGLGE